MKQHSPVGNSVAVLKEAKNRIGSQKGSKKKNSLLDTEPKRNENILRKRKPCTQRFNGSSVHNSQNMEATKGLSIIWWMDKQNVINTYDRILFRLKWEEAFDTRGMNLGDGMLRETSQSQKDKYCMIPLN